jgi:hypothetical protein
MPTLSENMAALAQVQKSPLLGFQMAQERRMAPLALEAGQLDLMQKRAQIGATQAGIGQKDMELALRAQKQQQSALESQRKQQQEEIEFLSQTAYSIKDLPEQDQIEFVKRMAKFAPGLIPNPDQVDIQDIKDFAQMYEGRVRANSIERSKLALNIEKLKFERQKETNDQRKEQLDRDIRTQELELKRQSEQRQSKKLSAAAEKNLIQSQDAYGQFIEDSRQFKLLSDDYERLDPQGGVFASIDEFFAKVLGSQDEVNELRRRFNKIRISEGLKNLPPGPATDKDVELALKGVPAEGASKEQVMSFLRGASRMATISAAYNQFKSEYISDKGNTRGLIGSWREEVSLPRYMASRMGRETVSMAEIYETAIEEGVTKAEVMRRLGIE